MAENKDQADRKFVQIKIQPAVYQALKLVAADEGKSISDLLESVVIKFLSKRKIPDNVKQVFSG